MENDTPVPLDALKIDPRFIEQFGSPMGAIRAALVKIRAGNIERVERDLLKGAQMPCPVIHRFAPGIYIREINLPAGAIAIGARHKQPVLNVMLKGRVTVATDDGGTAELVAPMVFVGSPGKKVGFIHEETVWQNIFSTDETDIEKLEEMFVDKGDAWEEDRRATRIVSERDIEDRADYLAALAEYGFSHEQAKAEAEIAHDLIPFPFGGYKVMVSDSTIDGRGLFATADIAEGERIAPARIGGRRTPAGRYTNHSKTPNSEFVLLPNGDLDLVATRGINGMQGGRIGDEVTINYRRELEIRRGICRQLSVQQ